MAELAAAQARTQEELSLLSREMRAFKDESEASGKRLDRSMGELANKLGRLVEDIVSPGLPTVFRQIVGLAEEEPVESAMRVRRRHPRDPGRMAEYDVIVKGAGRLLVCETRSTLRPEDLDPFMAKLAECRALLPEAEGCAVLGAFASFVLDDSLTTAVSRKGLVVIGLGTGLLVVRNPKGFSPREF